MANQSYYDILGVSKSASQDEIKKAYHKLAKKHHPDRHQHDRKDKAEAEKKFKEIQGAYDILGDAEKRKQYDQFGEAAFQGGGAGQPGWSFQWGGPGGPGGGQGGGPGQGFEFSGGLEELLGQMMGGRGRSRGGRASKQQMTGQDVETTMAIPFRTAIRGGELTFQGPSGERLTARIPPGVANGAKLRLAGKGQPSPLGGPPGDLIVQVHTQPDAVFTRDGSDIYVELPISVAEAVLGATVDVPSLDGPVSVTVPAGTSSGQKLRLRGKGGLKSDGSPGDQYVQIKVVVPKNIDAESRKLIEEFAKRNKQSPRDGLAW